MHLRKTATSLLLLILIALAISPAFALGEGNRNLLLIGVMGLSPIIILYFGRFDRINPWLALFFVSILVFPPIFHPESMRWSTVLYSVMFCLTFMAYQELMYHSYFTPVKYLKILKYVLLAYFIVLLIQQICVLLGVPIFNVSNYNPLAPWKLNSLSAEPSHSARIVALLMYCYITMKELILNRKYNFKFDIKKDKWVWIAFVWTMATMGSGTAFLFLGVILIKFIRFRNLIPIFILAGGIIILVNLFEITAVERTYKTAIATLKFDEEAIIKADASAAMRIIPSIIISKKVNLNTTNGWFGNGIDYVSTFLYEEVPGLKEGSSGGGLLQLWLEYGFISFALFIFFTLSSIYKKGDYLWVIFWFLLVFIYNLNSQIIWLAIILFYSNLYFINHRSNLKQYLKTK